MIKLITLDDYISDTNKIIQIKGFRQCPVCKKITAGILRYTDDDYFYFNQIKDCAEHAVFDLIFANTEEHKGLMIYDRKN